MPRLRFVLFAAFFAVASLAQQVRFEEHVLSRRTGILGGVLASDPNTNAPVLFTWGQKLSSWTLPGGVETVLSLAPEGDGFGEGGCTLDVDGDGRLDLIVQQGAPLGVLVWQQASTGKLFVIDRDIETHDVMPASLFGRRGVLIMQRFSQLRFYEIPPDPSRSWPYQEVYSFYNPSHQGGLLMADIDGDGFPDILAGNYWVKSPAQFDLPWRLFAINTYSENVLSALERSAMADLRGIGALDLVACERELRRARLTWFEKPADPKQQWIEHHLEADLRLRRPQGLVLADFNRDSRPDIVVAENDGSGSRVFLFHNGGAGRFTPAQVAESNGIGNLWSLDLNGDGRPDLLSIGPRGISWWENRLK